MPDEALVSEIIPTATYGESRETTIEVMNLAKRQGYEESQTGNGIYPMA